MLTINRVKRRDLLVLLLILFVAALMRFGQPEIVEFFHDDAMLSSLAQDMVAGRSFPLTGINSSVGIPNPPTSVYTMAIPFALDSDPMTAILFIMGWNVIGVGLLWWLTHRYFSPTAALAAGFAYALNPWAILYSRKIWAQDFHTPFVLLGIALGLYGFWEASRRDADSTAQRGLSRHEWAQILCVPVLLYGFQIHFAAWALLPVIAVLLLIGWRRWRWRALILSTGLSLLVIAPYLVGFYQTAQANPAQGNPAAVSTLASDDAAFSTLSLRYLGYLATGFGMETWIAPRQQSEMNTSVPPVALWAINSVLMLLGVLLVVIRKEWRIYAPLLLLWGFLPALALIPQWAGVYPHYFIASIPALMLLIGLAVAWMAQLAPLGRFGRTVILTAFALILATQGIYWRGVLRYVDSTELTYPGFTTPIEDLHAVEAALADADDVLVLSDGMAWDLHHESVVWPVMLADTARCVRTVIEDGYAVFPAGAFTALQAPNMPENAIDGLYLREDSQTIETRPAADPYVLHHWDNAPEWTGAPVRAIEPARFEGDVVLTGYYLDEQVVMLEWLLPERNPDLNYQYGVHFYTRNGEKIGQTDTSFWQGRHWCAGDRLLTWMWITVPSETTALRVYLYQLGDATGPRYINANVLDAMNNPAGDHVAIPIAP